MESCLNLDDLQQVADGLVSEHSGQEPPLFPSTERWRDYNRDAARRHIERAERGGFVAILPESVNLVSPSPPSPPAGDENTQAGATQSVWSPGPYGVPLTP